MSTEWGSIGGCLLCLLGRGTGELDPVIGKCQDTALEVAKQSEIWESRSWFGGLRTCNMARALVFRLLNIQAQLRTTSNPGQTGEKGNSALLRGDCL